MDTSDRTIRVQRWTLDERGLVVGHSLDDRWLSRQGDQVTLEVPGGRVCLVLGGWSQSVIAYTRLTYQPIRSGLVRFGEGPGQSEAA